MLKQIGKYTISERIGRGTYSRVYRAMDAQGRPVAIKVSTTRTEPTHLAEFQKDLVAAASVLHPNLVALHDLGFEDDFPYLVIELVDGQDLAKLIKNNTTVSLAERIRVMQQVGSAMKSAHERGVFHLDIRPSKIMVGQDGTAKLLDLGLGRLSFDPARVTENGYLVGAPFYMSPERLVAIDLANEGCDIWSFGVTFHEWLSGRNPFYDDDGDRMIGNIMDGAPAELSNVPAPLNRVILRMLEKEPADRYHNFDQLLTDLKPLVVDLKREESDALMAEALKQTDSGRWHEARRIARQMRDLEPQSGPSSQIFGLPEQEEGGRPGLSAVTPATHATASAAAAAVGVGVAEAVETFEPTPEPAAAPEPMVEPERPVVPVIPPRPERTAPKIPAIGGGNGTPAAARLKTPAPVATNGVAADKAAVGAGRAERVSRPQPKQPPVAGPSSPNSVRILDMGETSEFPWARVLGMAIPALLVIGAALFFFWPTDKVSKAPNGTEEAKEITTESRVLKNQKAAAESPDQPHKPTDITPAPDAMTNTASVPPLTTDPLSTAAPRAFDPKTLPPVKGPVLPQSRGNGVVAKLAAPSLGAGAIADVNSLPVSLSAPPPPAPTQLPAQGSAQKAPEVTSQGVALTGSEASKRAGGVFAQPVLVHTVQPIYPPSAVQKKAQGIVRFQATIAKDGSVKDVQLLSGDPLLNAAARQAVLQWKYRPAMLDGEAVEVSQAIVVKFNLNNE